MRGRAVGKDRTTGGALACGGGAGGGAWRMIGGCARRCIGTWTGRGARGTGVGRGSASRRIGLGRAGSVSRCALPTTAFFEMPMRRPISAVEWPSAQSAFRRSIASVVQSIARSPDVPRHNIR